MLRKCKPREAYQYVALEREPSRTKLGDLHDLLDGSEASLQLGFKGWEVQPEVFLMYEDGVQERVQTPAVFIRTTDGSIIAVTPEEFVKEFTAA